MLRQLFHKERHPVGLDDDLREHFGGELSAACDALDEGLRLDSVETAKGHHRDVGRDRPWRFEFGTEGDQQQRRQSWNALEQEVQHFERSRIGPLRVLKQDQQRLLFREALHLVAQRRKGQAALLVGRTAHRGIPGAEWNRQHRCDQRGNLVHAVGRGAERPLQFVELDLGWLLRSDARRALELLGERIERAVAMIWRALVAKPPVLRLRDLIREPGAQARFANARFARDQHDLAVTRPRPALPREKLGALGLTTDEADQP